jgi:hypothetical protein
MKRSTITWIGIVDYNVIGDAIIFGIRYFVSEILSI